MTRVPSPSMIKLGKEPPSKCPREGSSLRRLYDTLMFTKGRPCYLLNAQFGAGPNFLGNAIEQLRNFYGLDIRVTPSGHHTRQYLLAGDWFGRVYVDYVVDRIDRGEGTASEIRSA